MIEVIIKIKKELSKNGFKISNTFVKINGKYHDWVYNMKFRPEEHDCIVRGQSFVNAYKMLVEKKIYG